MRRKKNHIYIFFFTENNVFYTDGDGQVNVGPLPPSDATKIEGIYLV